MKEQFPLKNYQWSKKKQIGKGSFGRVYKVKNLERGQFYAVKEINMKSFGEEYMKQTLRNQIQILKTLRSQYILQMVDCHWGLYYTYIITELCDTDIKKLMREKGGRLGQKLSIQYFIQLMQGFRVMVEKGYIHRDVKPENALIRDNICKLADFGFAAKADFEGRKKLHTICGTVLYMSPQLLDDKPYTPKCDIWSLGVTLYEMIFGYTPWPCRDFKSYLANIKTKPLRFPYQPGYEIGEHTKDFITKCLQIEEEKRISWKQIFQHPLIKRKEAGQVVAPKIQFDQRCQAILCRIQSLIDQAKLDIKGIFKNEDVSGAGQLNFFDFFRICKRIDSNILVEEVLHVFIPADANKDGSISFTEFQDLFANYDFGDVTDIGARFMLQLREIVKANGINVINLFDECDGDHNGHLDMDQLRQLIIKIAPNIPQFDLELVFNKFDADGNGKITLDQVKEALQDKNLKAQPNYQKCIRVIRELKRIMKKYYISTIDIVKRFSTGGSSQPQLNVEGLGVLVRTIDPQMTDEDVKTIFQMADINESGDIAEQQLQRLLQRI